MGCTHPGKLLPWATCWVLQGFHKRCLLKWVTMAALPVTSPAGRAGLLLTCCCSESHCPSQPCLGSLVLALLLSLLWALEPSAVCWAPSPHGAWTFTSTDLTPFISGDVQLCCRWIFQWDVAIKLVPCQPWWSGCAPRTGHASEQLQYSWCSPGAGLCASCSWLFSEVFLVWIKSGFYPGMAKTCLWDSTLD